MRGIFSRRIDRLMSGGLLTALLLAAAGCGSSSGRVAGKISYKNNPLRGGTVTFQGLGENGWAKTSRIADDGSYIIDDMPKGPAQVSVETQTVKPNRIGQAMAARMTKGKNIPPEMLQSSPFGQAMQADKYVAIPPKYSKAETSGLTYEVKGGKQQHDLNLD
jgi:hypothetical protein